MLSRPIHLERCQHAYFRDLLVGKILHFRPPFNFAFGAGAPLLRPYLDQALLTQYQEVGFYGSISQAKMLGCDVTLLCSKKNQLEHNEIVREKVFI